MPRSEGAGTDGGELEVARFVGLEKKGKDAATIL